MCEYCDTNDINRAKALDFFNNYKAKAPDSIVPVDDVFEHMFVIYKQNMQMADYAVKRIENKNVKCTPEGNIAVFAKDIVSELESLLSCHRITGINLDGQ